MYVFFPYFVHFLRITFKNVKIKIEIKSYSYPSNRVSSAVCDGADGILIKLLETVDD